MRTDIHLIDGKTTTFEGDEDVRITDHGVEITQGMGKDALRILFPWNRIEKVTQRGPEISATYRF